MSGIDDHHQDQASVARRTFLQQSAGLGLGLAALGLSGGPASAASASTSSGLAAAGGPRAARPLIIDALGGIDNPNLPQAARDSGRLGVILGFQNAAMMGEDAHCVDTFAQRGVRVIQLTYNGANQLGDGAMAPANRGLSPFGREVVQALDHNRVLIDLSHSGERTCLDAAAASLRPVAITHTGCRAVADLPRNKSDRELRMVAERGGFVGIYFMPFLAAGRQPMAADLVAHIEHALQVCGEDHVGLGTDGTVCAIDDMPGYLRALEQEVRERRASGVGATRSEE